MSNTIYKQNIRGMTNVSKLALQNFSGREAFDISQIYFPLSYEKQIKNIKVTTDVDTDTKLLDYVSKRTFFYDKNKNKIFDDDEQLAYNIYIYTSKDAIKLDETFENSEAKEDDVLIFVEDNTGDISSQYCRVKKGKNVVNNLKKLSDLYDNRELYERVNKFVAIDQNTLSELLEKEKIENVTLKSLELLFAAPDILGTFSPNATIIGGLGTICEEIAKFINKAKVDDYRWNPQAQKVDEKGEVDETHKFTPFLFPFVSETLDSIDDFKANEYMQNSIGELKSLYTSQDQIIRNYVENVDMGSLGQVPLFLPYGGFINIEIDLVPDSIEAYLYSKYLKAKQVIDNVFVKLESFDFTDLIKKGVNVANAFLCGIWNGLVDAISGIFTLLEMVFKAAAAMIDFQQNFSSEFPVLLEYIDNFTDALDAIDFKELYKHLKSKLSGSNLGVSLETIAYYSGAVIGFVISLVIEIVVGILFTGGTLSVAAVIEKLTAIFSGLARGVSKIVKKAFNFSKNLVVNTFKGFKKLLQELIDFLKQGTAGFKKMIDDLFAKMQKTADDIAIATKLKADEFVAKLPKRIAKFINYFPEGVQKRVVNNLLVLEFQGKRFAKINPKGIFVEITYFSKGGKYTKIADLKKVKLELDIVDDFGKTTKKTYTDNIEVVKTSDNSVGFRAKFENGKVRDADYVNHTFERSGQNPPFQTKPKSKAKVKDSYLKENDDFYIVENLEQKSPGGFLTNEPIYTEKDLRNKLSVLEDWKNSLNDPLVIRKYKVLEDVPVREGYIGPMIETSKASKNFGKTYPGGNYQYETINRFSESDLGVLIDRVDDFEQILK